MSCSLSLLAATALALHKPSWAGGGQQSPEQLSHLSSPGLQGKDQLLVWRGRGSPAPVETRVWQAGKVSKLEGLVLPTVLPSRGGEGLCYRVQTGTCRTPGSIIRPSGVLDTDVDKKRGW